MAAITTVIVKIEGMGVCTVNEHEIKNGVWNGKKVTEVTPKEKVK